MRPLRLVPAETSLNFVGQRFIAFVFSVFLVCGSLYLGATKGLNFGIDFSGGTLVEIRTEQPANIAELRGSLGALGLGGISIQEFGDVHEVLIRIPQQDGGADAQKAAMAKVRTTLGDKIEYRRVEFVGPQVGAELIEAGIKAMLFSLLGILIYIWIRFEWQFGIAAIVALAHDAAVTIGLFSLTQMEFNLSTVAAVLMIAGYSINDTVVVFDRVRENLRRYKKKALEDLLNLSVNQMLSRTLMTSLTTLLALIALWYFGGEVIRGFVNALIFGILIGTYSSVFVASPLLMYMKIERGGSPVPASAAG